ncbi:MAG: hypothetical protein ACRBFS_18845 [Aureispira sp.]
MIRSKIDPSKVQELAFKDYAKLFEKALKQAKEKGVDKVPLIMVSDFQFACGETHALVLLGKQSEMTKVYKGFKLDEERKKLKDFSIGFCHLDKEEDGSHSMRIAIEGLGKPNKMKKNSKKLIKKLGINLKDIIKGQFKEETPTPEEDTTTASPKAKAAKKKREKQVQQITTGLEKLQEAIGKIPAKKLHHKLEHYQKVLDNIIGTATADNELDEAEKADFDRLQTSITAIQEEVNEQGTTLTPEIREKMQVNMKKMTAKLQQVIKELNAL